ncbi:MAG TPA: LptA/OstA family protein, partial [Vicinamibacteria bacterium]|nr:LptA/OstA family protein [Vicinamibacteria bacterium]
RAVLKRRQNWLRYVDDVHVRHSDRSLACNDLQVYFSEDRESIEHLEAYENVDLRMNVSASEEPGDLSGGSRSRITSEPGLKRLLTDKLEVYLREGGEHLERVRALEGARLVMTLLEGAQAGYHKELEGYTLAFDFDEEGRLTVLRGRGGVMLVLTPMAGSNEQKKIVTARQLETDFDPITGDMLEARCERSVTFEQGDARAEAEQGTFRVAESLLVLEESPRLWDQRARLEADEIRINVDSGDVEGLGAVRSTTQAASDGRVFPGNESDEAVYFVADRVRYDRNKDLAIYTDHARGFQGQNRIEADRIEISQSAGDLDARGGVRTVIFQRLSGEADGPPRPTVTLAEELDYRSRADVMLYRGHVDMRAESMSLTGEELDLKLAPGSGEVRELHARGQVEIQTPNGKAAGDAARYSPSDDQVTVTGERAWMENDGKLTEAKQLTFSLTDDTIFVDGQEQNRTKTTYSSKPRPH